MLPQVNYVDRTLEGPVPDITVFFRYFYEHVMGGDWQSFVATLWHWWDIYSVIAIILSLLFIAGYIYASIRHGELHEEQHEMLHEAEHQWALRNGGAAHHDGARTQWQEIEHHLISNDPKAWRLAIIEADIMLEETLTNAGYVGPTVGDKLKSANASSFTTLEDAWEAHKVRNQIAHEGNDFVLTKRLAQDTMKRYERVFREFGIL